MIGSLRRGDVAVSGVNRRAPEHPAFLAVGHRLTGSRVPYLSPARCHVAYQRSSGAILPLGVTSLPLRTMPCDPPALLTAQSQSLAVSTRGAMVGSTSDQLSEPSAPDWLAGDPRNDCGPRHTTDDFFDVGQLLSSPDHQ